MFLRTTNYFKLLYVEFLIYKRIEIKILPIKQKQNLREVKQCSSASTIQRLGNRRINIGEVVFVLNRF